MYRLTEPDNSSSFKKPPMPPMWDIVLAGLMLESGKSTESQIKKYARQALMMPLEREPKTLKDMCDLTMVGYSPSMLNISQLTRDNIISYTKSKTVPVLAAGSFYIQSDDNAMLSGGKFLRGDHRARILQAYSEGGREGVLSYFKRNHAQPITKYWLHSDK